MMKRLFVVLVILILVVGCSKKNSPTGNNNSGTLETERKKIVELYHQYSQKLIAQDYEGALALSILGSDGEGRLNFCKDNFWDKGCQSYTDFYYVEVELDGLNYGYTKGNCKIVDYCGNNSSGNYEWRFGFDSSCRKIDGKWKIDAINSDYEVDWWR